MKDWLLIGYYNKNGTVVDRFYDDLSQGQGELFNKINDGDLVALHAKNEEKDYVVDLENGDFSIDDTLVKFDLGAKIGDNKRKLIFYKSDNYFAFGWQITIKGINYHRIMKIGRDGIPVFLTKN